MPTISKINPNGGATVYDLKDTSATNSITKIYAGLAPNYDNNTEYSTNDVVIYNGELYKNIQDPNEYIPAGSFNPLYWEKIATAQECQKVANTITSNEFSFTSDYNIGDIVRYNDKLYRFKVYHEWETEWNNSEVEQVDIIGLINEVALKGTVYTFYIDPDEADSYEAVLYNDDAVGMTPASMGATTFNYGSWAAFINKICKPCMLKFDGTVDYYLDPNDYSKKVDGTASDVADLSYPGNAMVEFSLLWWKSWGDGWTSIADYQVDATYKCWSNRDADGNIIPYFYLPIYNGCIYDGKMRSISGIQLKSWSTTAYSSSATYAVGDEVNHDSRMWKCITAVETPEDFDVTKWEQFAFNGNITGEEEIAYATANNVHNKQEWYTDVFCDRGLINALLVLISKSIDTQGTFGRGIDTGSQAAKEAYITGSLNDKGLFWGSTSNGNTASKVFGMENWLGLEWRRTAGLIGGANNTYLYKMTGPYNTTGAGYSSTGGAPSTNNWISKMKFGEWGMLPSEVSSENTKYYKDFCWTGTGYANLGGAANNSFGSGAFCLGLDANVSRRAWNIAASLSCKPCAISSASKYPDPPTTNGAYTLQLTVSSGVPTYTWAAVNRSIPAVNEPDEEELKKKSEEISEEKEIAEEKELDVSEKDVSEPAEKKEDISDESEKELKEEIPVEEEKSELTDENKTDELINAKTEIEDIDNEKKSSEIQTDNKDSKDSRDNDVLDDVVEENKVEENNKDNALDINETSEEQTEEQEELNTDVEIDDTNSDEQNKLDASTAERENSDESSEITEEE